MLLTRGGRLYPKILDFGVAKFLDGDPTEATTAGRMIGTPLYLSPEQVLATGSVSERSDVFALGVLLFEMLTLRRAWLRADDHSPLMAWRPVLKSARNSKEQVLHRIAHGPRPSIRELRPELPEAVDRVVSRALSVDPKQRYDSPGELSAVLTEALRGGSIGRDTPSRAKPTRPI
jgi:eukaryotic-like serine/threonine-protein kinase